MSEMVERVARAIALSDGYDSWETAHELTVRKYSDMARAAIEAMRSPNIAMICLLAGALATADDDETTPGAVWNAIIDEALK